MRPSLSVRYLSRLLGSDINVVVPDFVVDNGSFVINGLLEIGVII